MRDRIRWWLPPYGSDEPTGTTPLRVALRRPWPGTRRGLVLWLFGLGFILIGGVNYIGTPIPAPTRVFVAAALDYEPASFWGWIFVGVGVFACFTSYCHFNRDHYGYMVASFWAASWGLVYVMSFFAYDAPPRAIGGSCIWFLFAALLVACAGFPRVSLASLTAALKADK